MPDSIAEKFLHLVRVIEKLRRECPWDRQQTAESLRQFILEEAFETIETIDRSDWSNLKGELGDLLLQIILQSVIAAEKKYFDLEQVIENITVKMIERHPHVFADRTVDGVDEILHNWEQIKVRNENRISLLEGVPSALPALLRAQRLQEKAATVNFDWPDISGVIAKVEEELRELGQAVREKNTDHIAEELGDLLFSLVNLSRFLGLVAEDALRQTNEKFISRFKFIEDHYQRDYSKMKQAGLEELDRIWNKSKEH